jgi:endonuclease YncB( thermonuclease family)
VAAKPDRNQFMQNPGKGAFKRLFLFLACCLVPALAEAGTACPALQADETVRVRYVHDGDTVHLEDGRKIRLIGINTPELARDDKPEQAFAREARESLNTAISLHDNRIGLVFGKERFDRYKRTLAHLFTPDGRNLQALLLQQGMAMAITHPPNTRYSECYASQERMARCQHKGLWADPAQVVIKAADLGPEKSGFQLVTGNIEHFSQTDKGIRLIMSELMIAIRSQDLAAFDVAELASLPGKTVTVRGWLHPDNSASSGKSRHGRSVRYYLRLRHPSALEISPAATKSEC